ncbi:MAG: hypothetical protein LBE44_01590 [Microbacterium hominis]|jgi:hypothetical protein|nr:hypothetical protein [Microbacterium hominis]
MRDSGAQITTSESILYQIMRALPLLRLVQPREANADDWEIATRQAMPTIRASRL